MSKKTVRASLPFYDKTKLSVMAKALIEEHKALGADSPLEDAKVNEFELLLNQANEHHKNARNYSALAQSEMQMADNCYGMGKGQYIYTEKTVLSMLSYFRAVLMLKFQGREEHLSSFGFNVVIGACMPGRKSKKNKGNDKSNE